MSNILIVFCHPCSSSLNSYIKSVFVQVLSSHGKLAESNVYEDYNNKLTTAAEYIPNELLKIQAADVIIFQFPVYFGGFPALLHDWYLRVIEQNRDCFSGKKIIISCTLGGRRDFYNESGDRGSLDAYFESYWDLYFRSKAAIMLQPYCIFFDEFTVPETLGVRVSELTEKLKRFEEWPVKYELMEKVW
jgi:putative NADPH-quinone reductase